MTLVSLDFIQIDPRIILCAPSVRCYECPQDQRNENEK
jgi:hypothetical protein